MGLMETIYIGSSGNPRFYKPPDVLADTSVFEKAGLESRSYRDALIRSKRALAVGIVAAAGAVSYLINQPDTVGEFLKDFTPVILVQSVNYVSFTTGQKLARREMTETFGKVIYTSFPAEQEPLKEEIIEMFELEPPSESTGIG